MSDAKIVPIKRESIQKICSGQVVVTMAIAVKELLENGLDAGATKIDIKFKEFGAELIEVVDNGSGIQQKNFDTITEMHCTSKLSSFEDLSIVTSFGFRGEALSSLCQLCKTTIHTYNSCDPVGSFLTFGSDACLLTRADRPRQPGSTVSLGQLFHTLPVRRAELLRNIKREYARTLQLVSAYCVVMEGVQIVCSKLNTNGSKQQVLSNGNGSSLKNNMSLVFGQSQMSSLVEICEESDISEDIAEEFSLKPEQCILDNTRVSGWVSGPFPGQGRSCGDRQFCFVNGRPCDLPRLSAVVNESYRHLNRNQTPVFVIKLDLPTDCVDVNLAPDKRHLLLSQERQLLALVKTCLQSTWSQVGGSGLSLDKMKMSCADASPADCAPPEENDTTHLAFSPPKLASLKRPIDNLSEANNVVSQSVQSSCKRNRTLDDFLTYPKSFEQPEHRNTSNSCDSKNDSSHRSVLVFHEESLPITNTNSVSPQLSNNQSINISSSFETPLRMSPSKAASSIFIHEISQEEIGVHENHSFELVDLTPNAEFEDSVSPYFIDNMEAYQVPVVKKSIVTTKQAEYSLDSLKKKMEENSFKRIGQQSFARQFRAKIDPSENTQAEGELKSVLNKDSFRQLRVIGQFNLGFIICSLDQNLFIIDQHASDEKFNFEDLDANLVLQSQKLVCPKQLQLTVSQEQTILDHLEVFHKNGFEFEVNQNANVGLQLQLVSIPISKNYVFGADDVDEMTFMLSESLSANCRPSRVHSMLASRACRKSIMIGTALTISEMRRVLDHMSALKQPWNCPHGRPTIRHLFFLNLLSNSRDY